MNSTSNECEYDYDGKEQTRIAIDSNSGADLAPKAEVTLFVAGKTYMGKQMKYLGRE
jgi:hypothetical protein